MPKKNMTEAERKAFGEKMKKAREAKKLTYNVTNVEDIISDSPAPSPETTIAQDELDSLLRRVQELESRQTQSSQSPQFTPQGGLVGTFEKYILDPANYPSPVLRLAAEPRLRRFAFDDNYELEWNLATTSYETRDGRNVAEPKFTLKLVRKVYDEVTNEPTNKRYVACQIIMFEDPQAAITIARENGIEVDQTNEKRFLDEMRYIRLRDWLLEAFYPSPPQAAENKREVVIGNKLVTVYEVNSEQSTTLPSMGGFKKF